MIRTLAAVSFLLILIITLWGLTKAAGDASVAAPDGSEPVTEAGLEVAGLEKVDDGSRSLGSGERSAVLPRDTVAQNGKTPQVGSEPLIAQAATSEVLEGVFLVGSLAREDGTPWSEAATRWELTSASNQRWSQSGFGQIETDDGGRFRLRIPDHLLADARPRTLVLRRGQVEAADRVESRVALAADLRPGDNDVGELLLAQPPLLAAGRVVDQQGSALGGAVLGMETKTLTIVPQGADPTAYAPFVWVQLDDVEARSGNDGAFELRGFTEANELRVTGSLEGYLPRSATECLRGADEVSVVLVRGGGIAGRLVLDDDIPADLVRVQLHHGSERASIFTHHARDDLAFSWNGLAPETALVRVLADGLLEPVAEVADLQVFTGIVTTDPRLDPLDLRGAISVATIHVLGADGAPLEDAVARVLGGRMPGVPFLGGSGLVEGSPVVLGPGSALDVEVWGPGHRAVVLHGVRGETEVQLERGREVRVRLEEAPEVEEGQAFHVMLELFEDEIPHGVAIAPIEVGGEATLTGSHTGRHQISVWLDSSAGQGHSRSRIMEPAAVVEFELDDSGPESTLTVRVTNEGLESIRRWSDFR